MAFFWHLYWHWFGIYIGIVLVFILASLWDLYWHWFGIYIGIYIGIGLAFILALVWHLYWHSFGIYIGILLLEFIVYLGLALVWQQVLGTLADSNLEFEPSNLRVAPDIGARVGTLGTLVEYVDGGAWVEHHTEEEEEQEKEVEENACVLMHEFVSPRNA